MNDSRQPSRIVDTLNRPLVQPLLVAGLALLAYSDTFHVPFVFDDVGLIVKNPLIRNLNFSNLFSHSIPGADSGMMMRIVAYLTLALNFKIGGLDVTGYHLFNLAVHIFSALLVYKLVLRTLGLPFFQDEAQGSSSKVQGPTTQNAKLKTQYFIPLFTALLFAVHPIQTQAVTYVIQRMTSLAAFFCLLSLTSYIDARLKLERKEVGKSLTWFIIALAAAVAAMKTKEIAFTLPIVIALYDFLFLGGNLRKRLLILTPLLLTMLIIPLSLISTKTPLAEVVSKANVASRVAHGVSRFDYLCTQFLVIVSYLRLLVLPVNQNLDHDFPLHPHFFAPEVLFSFLFLAAVFGVGVYLACFGKFRSRITDHDSRVTAPESRLIGFGILWFFITLAVESSIIPIPDVMNEHRLYLPSVGFFLAVVAAAAWLLRRLSDRPALLKAAPVLAALITLTLTGATFARNQVWQDEVGLWKDVIAKSPGDVRGYNSLGIYYDRRGDHGQAIAYYQRAIAIKPHDPEALFNMGVAEANLNHAGQAIYWYQRALAVKPDDPKTYYNIGVSYMSLGQMGPATAALQEAVRLDPKNTQARLFLSYTQSQLGK
jgi:protein O-mannosyl-transferase